MPVYNFSAGPAVMPASVIQQIQQELPSFQNSGMSILEISHRSALFEQVITTAEADLRELLAIPDGYSVLFCQGGGTLQFTMAPMNLATKHQRIGLLDSGHWAVRAAEEAEKVGVQVTTLASTKDQHYTSLPHITDSIPTNLDYLHVTTNNTIEGTTYRQLPATNGLPLVADMSSNFLGEQYRISDFDLVFAGAQKNLGPAGLTVVIVKNSRLGQAKTLPSMLDYKLQADKHSMLNTPPVFAIYAAGLVLKWLKNLGGLSVIEKQNQVKAAKLYDFLDQSKMFNNPVITNDRSLMNVPFTTNNPDLDQQVIAAATNQGLLNLKGHRSVGGLRASLYNAMPLVGVETLVDFLNQFEQQH